MDFTGVRLFFILIALLLGFNMSGQNVFDVVEDTVDLVYHPIQKHFDFAQNNLVVKRKSKEMAATFDDPSRVLYRHTGITIQNDQNNAIIYRGLPSEYMRWAINGAEIVSPNHLSNAGRILDEPSPSSGGVLGIPFDVINSFVFHGSPYGNGRFTSLSGVGEFDFDSHSDSFIKLGLLGMEAGIQTKEKIPIKAHIRYSTVGLLNDLGVDFDGEQIKFYDAFLRAELSDKLSFTISRGISKNDKDVIEDINQTEEFKDFQRINMESDYWIAGFNYTTDLQHHSLYYSRKYTRRGSNSTIDFPDIAAGIYDRTSISDESMFSYNGSYKWIKNKSVLGLNTHLKISEWDAFANFLAINDFHDNYARVSGTLDHLVNKGDLKLRLIPELAVIYHLRDEVGLRPESAITMDIKYKQHALVLNGAYKVRLGIAQDFAPHLENGFIEDRLNEMFSGSATYKYHLGDLSTNMMVRAYYWRISGPDFAFDHLRYNEPLANLNTYFDWFSEFGGSPFIALDKIGRGVELMFDRSWNGGLYTNANFTLMDNSYENDTYFFNEDLGYVMNFVVSKEFQTKRDAKIILNMAFHARDGMMSFAFNPNTYEFVSRKLKDYNRLDLRVQWSKKKTTWTLDIQNVMSRANEAYLLFDPYLDSVIVEEQLTMIPILSYRRTF